MRSRRMPFAARALAACVVALALAVGGTARAVDNPPQPSLRVFNFQQTPLADVLRLLTEMTKKNVVATPSILMEPVTLYLEDVPPLVALGVLCKNYNYWYAEEDGVIRVMKLDEYGRELMLRRDERTEIFALKYASCIGVAETIRNVYQDAIEFEAPSETALKSYGHVGTDELPSIGEAMEELDTGTSSSNRSRSRSRTAAKDAITAGEVEMDTQGLGRLRQIVQTEGQVTAQQLLEYSVGRTKAQLTVFPRNNAVLVRSVDTKLLADIREMVLALDTPTPQVLLECKILEVQLSDGFESFFDFGWTPGGSIDSTGTVTSAVPGRSASGLGGAGLAQSALSFSYLNANVQARMQLLQSEGRLRSLASPLVYTANNAAARFFQGDKTPVRSGYSVNEATYDSATNTVVSPAQLVTEYEVEDVGVTLEVSPSINQDKTVTLKLVANIGSLQRGAGPTFNYSMNGQNLTGDTDLITETRIEDIILAKDGQSLAIGGLIRETQTEDVTKVPVLGDIPVLGFFFRNQERLQKRTEIVFVLTAHILESPEGGAALNERVMPAVSDHPWYKGQERLLEYDATHDELTIRSGQGAIPGVPSCVSTKRGVRRLLIGD